MMTMEVVRRERMGGPMDHGVRLIVLAVWGVALSILSAGAILVLVLYLAVRGPGGTSADPAVDDAVAAAEADTDLHVERSKLL